MKLSRIDELGDKYPVLLRSLRRRQGFGIAFVECSLAQATELSRRLPEDLPTKHIETLELNEPIDELYPVVAALPNPGKIDILLVVGLEKSVVPYIREGETGYGGVGGYYQRDTVPRIMGHLNMQRERFRDDFDICFVFLLPRFALNYVRHRAADFFDWRSGVYAMQRDEASLAQESSRLLEDTDWDTYRSLTPVQRQERLLEIGDLIDAPLTGERKAQLWREKGRLLAVEEEYEEAIASYDKAVEFKPDLHEAWNNRGVALGNLGRYEEEIASYDKAVEFKPDDHQAWYNRGVALRNLKRTEEALASYHRAIELNPNNASAWYNTACLYAMQQNLDAAISHLQKAIDLDPKYRDMAKTDTDF
ncbi:MAG: tetratricopeptide repeat protein, partial [Geitlerinemataceae cyanobacterium]